MAANRARDSPRAYRLGVAERKAMACGGIIAALQHRPFCKTPVRIRSLSRMRLNQKTKRRMIMTVSSKAISPHEAVRTDESSEGFFDRAFRRFVAAREARARTIAYQHLAHLSEERLLDLGFEPAEIKRLRAYAGPAPHPWS
jgi:uncharacterized protein YjiS (DUF1127 family)